MESVVEQLLETDLMSRCGDTLEIVIGVSP